jgi:hypothetical protein
VGHRIEKLSEAVRVLAAIAGMSSAMIKRRPCVGFGQRVYVQQLGVEAFALCVRHNG